LQLGAAAELFEIKLQISLPKISTIKVNKMSIPAYCAFSKNDSLKGFPMIISKIRNKTCPPSKAGIGRIFINAKPKEMSAVNIQKRFQTTSDPKNLAMPIGP
jgi:hypothetical protein